MRTSFFLGLSLIITSAACAPKGTSPAPVSEPIAVASHGLRLEKAIAVPRNYRVTLAIDPQTPQFSGVLESDLVIQERASDFFLNGQGLTVQKAVLLAAGESFQLSVEPDGEEWLRFRSARPFPKGPAVLEVHYSGTISDTDSFGIFRQRTDADWYIFTQFEAQGARRAFPCVDQPNLKVPFSLRLEVPSGLLALSNTPEVSRTSLAGGRVAVQFAETKPLPSYLVAFAVGPFDMVDLGTTRNQVPVRVAVPKGRGNETSWVKESTLPIIAILEDYVGSAYPFAKLDMVSIPATGHFSAMENPGLMTFTETLLLSKNDSLSFRQSSASTNAHELAHQWFGNLVTNLWWDEIWLNESFATWAAAKTLASFRPEWSTESSWLWRRESAMSADRLASARVIRQPIVTEADIGSAFDSITYAKGALVLQMFESWIGEANFQKGIRHYLRSRAWKTATAADFLVAMDQGSGAAISVPFQHFLTTVGTPLVSFDLACETDSAPVLTMKQSRYLPLGSKANPEQLYQVPVCVRFPGSRGDVRQCTLLSDKQQTLVLDQAGACPTWFVPNAGGTGYYRSELSETMRTALFAKAPLTTMELLVMATDLNALVRAGRAPMTSVLSLVPSMAKSKNDTVVATAAQLASLEHLVSEADRPRYQKWLSKNFGQRARALGWVSKAGETAEQKDLRNDLVSLMIFEGEDQKLLAAGLGVAESWLHDPQSVDPDLAGLALKVMAWRGDSGLFDRFIAAIKKNSDRSRRRLLLAALGRASTPALVQRVLGMILDPEVDVRESQRVFTSLARQPESSAAAFAFLVANIDPLIARYGRAMSGRLARVVGAQCDPALRAQVESVLTDKIGVAQGGANVAKQALESYELCVAAAEGLSLPSVF